MHRLWYMVRKPVGGWGWGESQHEKTWLWTSAWNSQMEGEKWGQAVEFEDSSYGIIGDHFHLDRVGGKDVLWMVLGIELRLFFNAISYSFITHVVLNVQGIVLCTKWVQRCLTFMWEVFSFSIVEKISSCRVGPEDLIYVLNTVRLSLWRRHSG